MGHCHWSSSLDLLLKSGHHTAPTTNDVAKTDDGIQSVRIPLQGGDPHLSDPLTGPHHASGVYRFIGRDVDKSLHLILICQLAQDDRPHHINSHCLIRMFLQEGDVFVSCDMKHNVGALLLENLFHSPGIGDICQHQS